MFSNMGAWLSTTFLKPAKPKPVVEEPEERPLTEEEQRQQAKMLDPTERKIGYIAVGLGLLISFGLTLPYVFDRHLTVQVKQASAPTGAKCPSGFTYVPKVGSHAAECNGKVVYPVSHWLILMVLLLVFAIAMFVTVRLGRRLPVGFAIFIAGIAYESIVGLLGVLFIVPGAWLLFKSWKVRNEWKVKDQATRGAPPPGRGSTGGPSSTRPRPPGGQGTNKRYTPKAAPAKAAPARGARSKAAPAKGSGSRAAPAKAPKKRPTPPAS
jgi:hypothetical protein